MFGYKNKRAVQTVVMEPKKQTPEEIMGLKEYVSIDSIKAHLVDILEENKILKDKIEGDNSYLRRLVEDYRKKYELSQIAADEYRKRLSDEQGDTRKLRGKLDSKQREYDVLKKKNNDLVCEFEMKRAETVEPVVSEGVI